MECLCIRVNVRKLGDICFYVVCCVGVLWVVFYVVGFGLFCICRKYWV